MKHDADDTIARLLRDRVEPGPPAGSCLDAEIVAAWFDGTLTADQQREAEAHASACARCQALLATMAQAEPVAAPSRRRLLLIRWFAPALAAAAAVLVWINVGGRSSGVPSVPSDLASEPGAASTAPAQQTGSPQAALNQPTPSAPSAKPVEKRAGSRAVNESAKEARAPSRKAVDALADSVQPSAPVNAQETGAAAPTVPLTANRQARPEDAARALQRDALAASPTVSPIVRSADGSLWRIAGDGTVGRSTDNGTSWREQALGSSARFLAGSSPSPNVVWFAGAAGAVVVTLDGVSWQWRSLPEHVDLTGIAAVDGQTATVTARDGRRFVTHDGGLTWAPAAAQENPPAPF